MIFQPDFLRRYVGQAPLALALERSLEGTLYTGLELEHPILDVGCGEGLFAHILFGEPIDTGLDPNPRELDRARELGAYNELLNCTGDAVPKPGGAYRTVMSNSVLEHIPHLEPVLAEVYRLLAPGGRFYATVPSEYFERYSVVNQILEGLGLEALSRRYRRFFNRFWVHHHTYSLEAWQALFKGQGFEIETAFLYASKRSCLLNDALVPVSLPAYVVKKFTNRWTFWPPLRRFLFAPVAALLRTDPGKDLRLAAGGLVFLHARKPL